MFAPTAAKFVFSNSGNFRAKANPPKPRSCPKRPFSDRTKWYRTKWHGQNGTDKMVWDKMVWDKMVWIKWYGQNGTDKMVVIFRIDYNSSEFNSSLVTKSHSEMINIQRRPKRLKVEAGLMK